jgi:hypothetical protein
MSNGENAGGISPTVDGATCSGDGSLMPLRTHVEHVLAGRYDRAGVPRPQLELADLEWLARQAHGYAGLPTIFPDPRHIAVAIGLRLLPRAPRGVCGEGVANGVIAFRPDPDGGTQGLRVFHGLAHAILLEERQVTGDGDAWALTALLIVPPRSAEHVRANMDAACAHAPRWMVEAALSLGIQALAEAG